jgi:hypothetical protein
MLRALFPQAVFMPTQRSLHATVKLHSQYYHTDVQALVDSGATDNFISPTLVKQCRIHTRTLEEPRTIRNVDGTKNTNCYVPCLILVLRAHLCFPFIASFLICTYRTALPLIPD